ncbi:unnamed protein product [Soboliphyme baturini]|uniref:Uncharacterized protein n=1 Tax=Soboliphyme baturini TaxID=241478 RepID=A0A183IYA8_9BILA|nr:unnamed protein product [Soboliphyme baturini]
MPLLTQDLRCFRDLKLPVSSIAASKKSASRHWLSKGHKRDDRRNCLSPQPSFDEMTHQYPTNFYRIIRDSPPPVPPALFRVLSFPNVRWDSSKKVSVEADGCAFVPNVHLLLAITADA